MGINIRFVKKSEAMMEETEIGECHAPQVPGLNNLVTLNGRRYEIVELDWVFQRAPFEGGDELVHVNAFVIETA